MTPLPGAAVDAVVPRPGDAVDAVKAGPGGTVDAVTPRLGGRSLHRVTKARRRCGRSESKAPWQC